MYLVFSVIFRLVWCILFWGLVFAQMKDERKLSFFIKPFFCKSLGVKYSGSIGTCQGQKLEYHTLYSCEFGLETKLHKLVRIQAIYSQRVSMKTDF